MEQQTETQAKVRRVLAHLDVSRVTFASMLGVDDSTVDAWADGRREAVGPYLMLIDAFDELAEFEPWAFERHARLHGSPPRKKGRRQRGGRSRTVKDGNGL